MSAREPRPAASRRGVDEGTESAERPGLTLSRRRLLGGALAGTLAAVLLGGERARGHRGPDRWAGKTRWIGHC